MKLDSPGLRLKIFDDLDTFVSSPKGEGERAKPELLPLKRVLSGWRAAGAQRPTSPVRYKFHSWQSGVEQLEHAWPWRIIFMWFDLDLKLPMDNLDGVSLVAARIAFS
jgi:hypothetical protein